MSLNRVEMQAKERTYCLRSDTYKANISKVWLHMDFVHRMRRWSQVYEYGSDWAVLVDAADHLGRGEGVGRAGVAEGHDGDVTANGESVDAKSCGEWAQD